MDIPAAANSLFAALGVSHLLLAGEGAEELAAALRARGADAVPVQSLTAVTGGPFEAAVLLAGAEPVAAWLARLAQLGLAPSFDAGLLGDGALLLRPQSVRVDDELRQLRQRLDAASSALNALAREQERLLDRYERLAGAAGERVDEILTSRTWRVLKAGGGMMLRIAGWFSRAPAAKVDSGDQATVWSRNRPTAYDDWIARFESLDPLRVPLGLAALSREPLVSILMAVERPDPALLQQAVKSLQAQSYSNWELCLAGPETFLKSAAEADSRVRLTGPDSAAALASARGEYAGWLGQHDRLAPDALFHMVEAILRRPEAGFWYSDEDRIDEAGRRSHPFFKPNWSPDLLLSENYVGGLVIARRELALEAAAAAGDYDSVLKLSERTSEIGHVSKVLYHRLGSLSADDAAARTAVQDHLRRAGVAANAETGLRGLVRVRYKIPDHSRVSILIAAGGDVGSLRKCLESVTSKTAYRDYEILVIDNSRGRSVKRLAESARHRYLDCRGQPFNFSALNNAGARACSSPLLLFLNDDTEVIEPGWLDAMVELGGREEVGAVGARLLYPDGRIQHAGVVLGLFESSGHAFRGLEGDARHYFDFPDVIRDVSAVTAACMLVRASVFREASGFDESSFPVAFNDIDFCLRLSRRGLRILYTPHAVLYHSESRTRGNGPAYFQNALARKVWGETLSADPYYSPHLTRSTEDYSLR